MASLTYTNCQHYYDCTLGLSIYYNNKSVFVADFQPNPNHMLTSLRKRRGKKKFPRAIDNDPQEIYGRAYSDTIRKKNSLRNQFKV